jgi:hypothetical protein
MDGTELTEAHPSAAPVLKGSGQGGDGVGELVPSLTGGWAAARWPSNETTWWWSGLLGGGALQHGEEERRAGEVRDSSGVIGVAFIGPGEGCRAGEGGVTAGEGGWLQWLSKSAHHGGLRCDLKRGE